MDSFENLFKPMQIGQLRVANRIMMAAIGTNYSTPEGEVTERLVDFFRARARGETGLIVTEGAYVTQSGKECSCQLGIHKDELLPGLKELADKVHADGAKIFIQLFHAGRQTVSAVTGLDVLAPSPIPCQAVQEMPRQIAKDEIPQLIDAFGRAARRAQKAGFDGVELLVGHGHLINQFLSPYSNKREDEYGGSLENRMRFALEVLACVREAVGRDYPISCRISAEEYVEGGLEMEESIAFARRLVDEGIELLHVSGATYESGPMMVPPMLLPQNIFAEKARELKKALAGRVPVAVAGRIKDPRRAEDLIKEGKTDLVALGRALLADPEFPRKAREGRISEIRKCIGCNQGCMDRLLMQKDITCLGNPLCGRESEYGYEIEEAAAKKKVLVIGGGPGGMEAARTASLRGHEVLLYEREKQLGGKMLPAAVPPGKAEVGDLRVFLIEQLTKLPVKVVTGHEVDLHTVEKFAPDAVILAAGSKPLFPKIPGIEQENVAHADDILSGEKQLGLGERVLVVGGGLVGCEIANFAAEQGKNVYLLEMLAEIGADIGFFYKILLMTRMQERGVELHPETTLKEIKGNTVIAEHKGEDKEFENISTVVIAAGYEPDRGLLASLAEKYEVFSIGDCKEVRKMLEAIHEGFECSFRL
ncbi:MAG: FAD-dependent oxidoreductase [Firmicutes bacterium]|nr:FAD-dependent oxidoreductase [Bacillota bacterium]